MTTPTEITETLALRYLQDNTTSLESLLNQAEAFRTQHFGRAVQTHKINNIKNGFCPEDCSYCAQRNDKQAKPIPKYRDKSDEEILTEAKQASDDGAFRYCMVSSGKGPSWEDIKRYTKLIPKIKERYKLQVCLSAGIIDDPQKAKNLAHAGLDRYNHNLNTSQKHYDTICTTHSFDQRKETLNTLKSHGVSLCSGLIVGMGESHQDIVDVIFELKAIGAASIPVNFYIPVPGADVAPPTHLTPEYCLRVLAVTRLANPTAEIRLAAGREHYLKNRQDDALRVANSLFIDGYLNVHGESWDEGIRMKSMTDLRPFQA